MKGILKFLSGSGRVKVDSNGDILELPKQNGVLIFPLSMAKIRGELSPEKLFSYLEKQIHPKWKNYPLSVLFLYTGDVYARHNLGDINKYNVEIENHISRCLKIINSSSYLIRDAFSFVRWDELFNCDNIILKKFKELKEIYFVDKKFQEYMFQDLKRAGKEFNSNNVDFLLEEMILPYLFVKGAFKFNDNFTKNSRKFKLVCYSGNPLKILVYIHKMNFFNLDKTVNVYQNCLYNLKAKFLFNFDDLDLEKFKDLGQFVVEFRR